MPSPRPRINLQLRQEDEEFDLSSLHDLELGEEEEDDDAELYDSPDRHPRRPKPEEMKNSIPNTKDDGNDESSKPMLTRQSEDGHAFSIGDDEFGNWAGDDDEDDDDT